MNRIILIGSPQDDAKCEYCGKMDELRPYGKNGAKICFDCAMKPENKATTDKAFIDILDGKSEDVKPEQSNRPMEITITFLSEGDEIFYGCTLAALKRMKLAYKEHVAPGSIRMTITVNDPMDAYYLGRLTIEARLTSFQSKRSES